VQLNHNLLSVHHTEAGINKDSVEDSRLLGCDAVLAGLMFPSTSKRHQPSDMGFDFRRPAACADILWRPQILQKKCFYVIHLFYTQSVIPQCQLTSLCRHQLLCPNFCTMSLSFFMLFCGLSLTKEYHVLVSIHPRLCKTKVTLKQLQGQVGCHFNVAVRTGRV
jgi:hypothetical protein